MDKLTPQQLKLEFGNIINDAISTDSAISNKDVAIVYRATASVVNFSEALLQRNKAKENLLYLQILDSVRNIG